MLIVRQIAREYHIRKPKHIMIILIFQNIDVKVLEKEWGLLKARRILTGHWSRFDRSLTGKSWIVGQCTVYTLYDWSLPVIYWKIVDSRAVWSVHTLRPISTGHLPGKSWKVGQCTVYTLCDWSLPDKVRPSLRGKCLIMKTSTAMTYPVDWQTDQTHNGCLLLTMGVLCLGHMQIYKPVLG